MLCQQISVQSSFESYNPATSLPPTAPLSILQSTRSRAAVLTTGPMSPNIAGPAMTFSPPANAHANLFNPVFTVHNPNANVVLPGLTGGVNNPIITVTKNPANATMNNNNKQRC